MEARDLSPDPAAPFELAMRIRHPSIDPKEISRELQLEPEHCFKAGDPRTSSSGIAAASVHGDSYWLCHLDLATLPTVISGLLEDQAGARSAQARITEQRFRTVVADSLGITLASCVMFFLRSHKDFLRRMQSEGGEVSLLVEVAAASIPGFKLTPQTSRGLSDLGITVDFEFAND